MEKGHLILGVKRSVFRTDDPNSEHSSKEFKSIRKEILQENKYACHYCGFQSKKFQEVHHLNDDHSDNSKSNLVVACPLCHSCNHIGLASIQDKGCLVYIDPKLGITQEMLNHIVRTLWVMEKSDDKLKRLTAISIMSRLYKQSHAARKLIGSSEPEALAQVMLEMSDKEYKSRSKKIKGMYLLPFKDYYENHVEYYANFVYKNIPIEAWDDIARSNIDDWFGDNKKSELIKALGIVE